MPAPASITSAIVDALYDEALALAEDARRSFEPYPAPDDNAHEIPPARIAMSCEALRTTTILMHSLAWLLNHRAFLAGEMSEFQLRRHGRLPVVEGDDAPTRHAALPENLPDVVYRARALHARITRLDRAWRDHFAMEPSAVHRLRERLGTQLAARG